MTDLRVSLVDAEVLTDLATPDLRVSSVTAEVLTTLATPDLRVSEVYVEVLVAYNPYEEFAAVVAATTTIPTPTVGVGGDATVNATVVPAVAAVTGHTPSAGATVTGRPVVAATTSIPTPSVSAGGATTVNPAVVPAVTTVPAPTVSDGTTPVTINPGVVPAVAAVPAPVVTGVNGTPPNTGQGGVFDTQDGNVPAFDGSGDTFIVAAPKSSFVLTYVPINYSEHVSVTKAGDGTATGWLPVNQGQLAYRSPDGEFHLSGEAPASLLTNMDGSALSTHGYQTSTWGDALWIAVGYENRSFVDESASNVGGVGAWHYPGVETALADRWRYGYDVQMRVRLRVTATSGSVDLVIRSIAALNSSDDNSMTWEQREVVTTGDWQTLTFDVRVTDFPESEVQRDPDVGLSAEGVDESDVTLVEWDYVAFDFGVISDAGRAWRKLQRGTEWAIAGKELQLRGDLEEIFVGSGPWCLEAQYAYGGTASGEIPEGDPPPDIDDPPPTVPPPAGAILYGSSPNGASGGSKSSIVAYVNSIFGGLNILRAFDDSPTAWGDTRTAQFQPMPSVVCISLKPGLANLAGGGAAKEKVKAFLRTIPASIPAVYITCHHEPENDTSAIPAGDANTGPLYKRMMAVFLAAVDEVRAEGKCQNVYTMSILMSFSILHRNPEDWYVAGVDVLGWDTYNRANLTALRNYSISKGKPWMVCEIGCKPVANYTDAQYADELEAMFNIWTTGATLPIAVCYFQSTVGDNYVITPETRPISTAWWRTLVTTGNPP